MRPGGLTSEEYELLSEIISRRDPGILPLLAVVRERRLSVNEREALRGVVADELVGRGLDEDDEPTAYGLQMERLIDALGHE